mmetsp:Transcript_92401/g.198059  ORF Transcript_92401/g.198059 Transcript_92401/m.198059 type:complete len:183 (-) Transcript_92401:433-981(-)
MDDVALALDKDLTSVLVRDEDPTPALVSDAELPLLQDPKRLNAMRAPELVSDEDLTPVLNPSNLAVLEHGPALVFDDDRTSSLNSLKDFRVLILREKGSKVLVREVRASVLLVLDESLTCISVVQVGLAPASGTSPSMLTNSSALSNGSICLRNFRRAAPAPPPVISHSVAGASSTLRISSI